MENYLVEEIAAKAALLPLEQQREILSVIEEMERRGKAVHPMPPRHLRLKGSTAGSGPTVTLEEIAEARREMWGEHVGDEKR